MSAFPSVVEVNVGGVTYTASLDTLRSHPASLLGVVFGGDTDVEVARDSKGRYFLDRDGVLFRYVLDYLRDGTLHLPESFRERERLRCEADKLKLHALVDLLNETSSTAAISSSSGAKETKSYGASSQQQQQQGCITVGYRGSFQFGKDGLADVKFRKLSRILVSGRVSLMRDVFGETLNESRDPDHGMAERYTSRFFLKHSFLEQAFDMLYEQGFKLVGSCGSGTAGTGAAAELKPGVDVEENRWNHYNEFVFVRE